MTSIIAYRKFINDTHTKELLLPENKDRQRLGTELATVDGVTYVGLPDGVKLPADQPKEIADSIRVLEAPIPDELRQAIRAASLHYQLIARRLIERIRARYSPDDEAYFTRIACGQALGTYTMSEGEVKALAEYQAVAEDARAWAKAERAKLGL